MPKLGIDIDNKDIDKTTDKFKKLNTQVDKTGKGVDNIGSKSQRMATTMSNAFKGFLIGGAIQKGFSAIVADIDKASVKAGTLADTLRTLRFLSGDSEKAEIANVKSLQLKLAKKYGTSPQSVGPLAADILSAASHLGISTRNQIQEEAAAAGAGGVGGEEAVARAITQTSLLDKKFQTPAGITGLNNAFNQGIKEAILLPQDIGILQASILAGSGAGLNVSESIANFAAIRPNTVSKDDAREKQKQVLLLYKNSGFREKGVSFYDWIDSVANTPFDKLPENYKILHDIIVALSKDRKLTAKKTSRIAAAQANPESLNQAAYQKQLDDPQTRHNIINQQQAAIDEILGSAGGKERAGWEAAKDYGSAAWNYILSQGTGTLDMLPFIGTNSPGTGRIDADGNVNWGGTGALGKATERLRDQAGRDWDNANRHLGVNTQKALIEASRSQKAKLDTDRRLGGSK